jgi:TetR/AcrR family tetracycline transcriptional repressor
MGMLRDDKLARELARLDDAERRTHERLTKEQERIGKRFDRMRQHLSHKYGAPSDSQQRIIEAALGLLGNEGLGNITLRKLASAVDMQAPALYWHFKDKEELIDYMAEAILQKEFADLQPRTGNESWQDWLTRTMQSLRLAMLRYPDGARVVAGAHIYPAVTLGSLFECAIASLESAGVELQTARHIIMTAVTYTFGFVIEEQAAPSAEEVDMLKMDAASLPYPKLLQSMREAHLTHKDMAHDYETGLRYIITGSATQ